MRVFAAVVCALLVSAATNAQNLPELTQPVNDFARVIDAPHAESMDRTIRALQAATGDVIVIATIETFAPFGSLEQYANKLFENHGRGIGEKDKANGILITVAVKDQKAWIEVGYGLEQYITDGFAGETARLYMFPEFRQNNYGAGLEAGLQRIAGRLAQARNVTLEGVPPVAAQPRRHRSGTSTSGVLGFIILFIIIAVVSSLTSSFRGPRGRLGGWRGGIGPFGGGWGGFGGGFGGGGFGGGGGGGFGGFGGGASGGGGGGGGW